MKCILCKFNLRIARQFVILCAMSTTQLTVFEPEVLGKARLEALDELEEQLSAFSRTAPEPEQRVAQAELCKLIRDTKAAWAQRGLIPQPEAQAEKAAMAA